MFAGHVPNVAENFWNNMFLKDPNGYVFFELKDTTEWPWQIIHGEKSDEPL